MSIHRWKRHISIAAIIIFVASGVLASVLRNRLSNTTIVGRWQGYTLQPEGVAGHMTVAKVPLMLTFRPDGFVIRGQKTSANYMVCDNALVFHNILSRNAPSHPALWNARLIGDTLTLSGSETRNRIEACALAAWPNNALHQCGQADPTFSRA